MLPASDQEINAAIAVAYDTAEKAGEPPNIMELRATVHQELKRIGRSASGNKIMKLAVAGQHAARRWERGDRQGRNMPIGKS